MNQLLKGENDVSYGTLETSLTVTFLLTSRNAVFSERKKLVFRNVNTQQARSDLGNFTGGVSASVISF